MAYGLNVLYIFLFLVEAGNGTASPLPKEPFHPSDCFMDKEKGPCRLVI